MANKLEKATLGSGCFWCTEAVFRRIKGVMDVVVGYAGGEVPNPTYEEVSEGTTGHAEVAQIIFNPRKISFEEILKVFFESHDPTSMNRQGPDVGPQYRSVIFYHNEKQRDAALKVMKKVQKNFDKRIVTQLEPLKNFYPAEVYHQNYFEKNPNAPYCVSVIKPKLKKLKLA